MQNLVRMMDPHLQNAWGVTKLPCGPLWVADCNYRLSTLYDGNGVKQGLTVTIPLHSGRAAPPAAAATGMVWNPTSGFPMTVRSAIVPTTCIFDTEDGTIAASSPAVDPIAARGRQATCVVDNSSKSAVYKGLAFGTNQQAMAILDELD